MPRLIPAHAGKTTSPPAHARANAAHPRSRGENLGAPSRDPPASGSSPLTRGKLGWYRLRQNVIRLIPAHAGKTAVAALIVPDGTAHPRSRGENPEATPHQGPEPRLIPAHAGKTPRPRPIARRAQAHPRSRGENVAGDRCVCFGIGSSPLTRGKQARRSHEIRGRRLIPAHAGKT